MALPEDKSCPHCGAPPGNHSTDCSLYIPPEGVTEDWLIPPNIVLANLKSEREFTDPTSHVRVQYLDLSIEARDKAAKLLYEYLSPEQVRTLRLNGWFVEAGVKVRAMYLYNRMNTAHPSVQFDTSKTDYCIAFGQNHELYPICDRLLSLLLKIRAGGNSFKNFFGPEHME